MSHPVPPPRSNERDATVRALLDHHGLPECRWEFPEVDVADEHGLVGVGADLSPSSLVTGYALGMFPMPVGWRHQIGWFSPDPRGVLPVDGLIVHRSLRRSCRRFRCTVDVAFAEVITACSDPERPHGWISDPIRDAYGELHDLGIAHSVEVWAADDELVGGLYGVRLGSFFAGESMFHRRTDASKVALVYLTDLLSTLPHPLLDVQWVTPHLASLGAVEIPRREYLELLGPPLRELG